jgi:hypothetical protein
MCLWKINDVVKKQENVTAFSCKDVNQISQSKLWQILNFKSIQNYEKKSLFFCWEGNTSYPRKNI